MRAKVLRAPVSGTALEGNDRSRTHAKAGALQE